MWKYSNGDTSEANPSRHFGEEGGVRARSWKADEVAAGGRGGVVFEALCRCSRAQ